MTKRKSTPTRRSTPDIDGAIYTMWRGLSELEVLLDGQLPADRADAFMSTLIALESGLAEVAEVAAAKRL